MEGWCRHLSDPFRLEGTFPTEPVKMTATGKMIELLKGDLYRQSKDSKSVSDYTQGADNGLTFVMMKDVDYNDDETEQIS